MRAYHPISLATLILLLFGLTAPGSRHAAAQGREVGFDERYALADNREKALEELIPGTEDYYYYYSLHYQNAGNYEMVEKVLTDWRARMNNTITERAKSIRLRQAILEYRQGKPASLEKLRAELNLYFNHQREVFKRDPGLPTAWPQDDMESMQVLLRAIRRHGNNNLSDLSESGLHTLMHAIAQGQITLGNGQGATITALQRRELLSRLDRPDYPRLTDLILDELASQNASPFGAYPIHRLLLLDQLNTLMEKRPVLLSEWNFVDIYMRRLHPGPDSDWRRDAKEREAYLDALWAFVSKLPDVHNSLKAQVLYQRLEHDREQGIFNKERFLEYLQYPRSVPYIRAEYLRLPDIRNQSRANLAQDFSQTILLPPPQQDEPLVRSYLEHFLLDAKDYSAFDKWIEASYLRRVMAETNLMAGKGDNEKWISWLSASDFKALQEKVVLEFAPQNLTHYGVDEKVSLQVGVKNVRDLMIRVFEINTLGHYLEYREEITTAVNLEGLVPTVEMHPGPYDLAPIRRERRTFDFPMLAEQGVYVVELIGNGKSSRAVVRKGRLGYVIESSAAGQVFSILDNKGRHLPKAQVWIEGHKYQADAQGRITVPFSTTPGRQAVIIEHDGFASLDFFQHEGEVYGLEAGFFVNREALIKNNQATVTIRPRVSLNGAEIDPAVLDEARLTILAIDREGVQSRKIIEDFLLPDDLEGRAEFSVPERLETITFVLDGKVQSLSQGKKIDLSVSKSFKINEIDKTEKVEDLHFRRLMNDKGEAFYAIDLLGKTGEPRVARAVNVVLKHRLSREEMRRSLQTDGDGRITLGPLHDIEWVRAHGPEGISHQWQIDGDRRTWASIIHAAAEQEVFVPVMESPADGAKLTEANIREHFSLLERRSDGFVRDYTETLIWKDGLISFEGLPAGDYDLWLKDPDRHITLRLTAVVADGKSLGTSGYHVGRVRALERVDLEPMQITGIQSGGKEIKIQMRNVSNDTRVHIVLTHFDPAFDPFTLLSALPSLHPALVGLPTAPSAYLSNRTMGEEARYILERRTQEVFPGNMLERPSLLLNPWEVRSTETGVARAAPGEEWSMAGEAPEVTEAGKGQAGQTRSHLEMDTDFANLDFLAFPGRVIANLEPDKNGLLTVKLEEIGDNTQLRIIAIDGDQVVSRQLVLAEPESIRRRDLRLMNNMDSASHYAEKRLVTELLKGQTLVLKDASTARFETYSDLASAHGLLASLTSPEVLREFEFVVRWHTLDAAAKREKYSKYACHELNIFLSRKDPEFFEEVVLPHIRNKREQMFIDHYLLSDMGKNADMLAPYTEPWAWGRLNVVEQALLGHALDSRRVSNYRYQKDRVDILPPDTENWNRLFDMALSRSALEQSALPGFANGLKLDALYFEYHSEQGAANLLRDGTASSGDRFNRRVLAAAAPAPSVEKAMDRPSRIEEAQMARQTDRKRESLRELAESDEMSERRKSLEDARKQYREFYRPPAQTKEYAENQYWHLLRSNTNPDLIEPSKFWLDYAEYIKDGMDGTFISQRFPEASRNAHEALLALAMLELPLDGKAPESVLEDAQLTLTAMNPTIVFHREILPAEMDEDATAKVLISQNFFRYGARHRMVNGEQVDNFVTEEFLDHVVYGCEIVVTNPTSTRRKVDVLYQVPRGAMPVLGERYTRSRHITLEPYHTWTQVFYFTFPSTGEFPHYPVHVSDQGTVLAFADAFTFNVVEDLSKVDTTSWDYVSQHGSPEDVHRYLREENLQGINLDRIAWRMSDKGFFGKTLDILQERHAYNQTLYSYGIKHDTPEAIREYLRHNSNVITRCAPYLEAWLITIDAAELAMHEHLEYWPLVNARRHRLGSQHTILNDRFLAQYRSLMHLLAHKPELGSEDWLVASYYFFLQDRVGDALEAFKKVDRDDIREKMQYDYLDAYAWFYRSQPTRALGIANEYAQYPVERWRKRFEEIKAQAEEIEGGTSRIVDDESHQDKQELLAATEPSLDLDVEARKVRIDYRNIETLEVRYYRMDVEYLFSRSPFAQAYEGQFASVIPNLSETRKLSKDENRITFDIPEALRNDNFLVEVIGAGVRRAKSYYANSLAIQLVENYGQVRVQAQKDNSPLPGVYVKVYARFRNGQTEFYKDGYTDLRGLFDYASLSTDMLDQVEQFAILILSTDDGAAIRHVAPPKR